MIELVIFGWLLGATAIFVGVAMTGEASDEPLWLRHWRQVGHSC